MSRNHIADQQVRLHLNEREQTNGHRKQAKGQRIFEIRQEAHSFLRNPTRTKIGPKYGV